MLENRTQVETLDSREGNSAGWGQIAASIWQPAEMQPAAQATKMAQATEPVIVVKPVEIGGQTINFPVTICPPGTASGLERPKPRPIVQGGSCSGR